MQYGFTSDDHFIVADDKKRIGVFAFPTSPYAERAKRNPAKAAAEMLDSFWENCPDHIREEHYELSRALLADSVNPSMCAK